MSDSFVDKLNVINTVFQHSIDSYETSHSVSYECLQDVVTKNPLLKTPLMPHQVRMVKAMHIYRQTMREGYINSTSQHHLSGSLGVVADVPGSGKTLSVLGFLASQQTDRLGTREHNMESNRFFFSHTVRPAQDVSSVSLVVVPSHLLQQWRNEVTTHTYMTPCVIDNRRLLRNVTLAANVRTCAFVLTTSKLYKDVYDYLVSQQLRLRNVVFDEASTLYLGPNDPIPDTLRTEFVWLISSQWLCFLFKNTYLDPLSLVAIRNQVPLHEEAAQWLDTLHHTNVVVSTGIEGSGFFKHLIPYQHPCRGSMILRNSTKHQPTLLALREHTIECSTKLTLASIPSSLLGNSYEGLTHERIPKLFRALDVPTMTLEQIVTHHSDRAALIRNKVDDNCSICIDSPQNKVIVSCCMNVFCGACILRQLLTHPQCPTCRALLFFPNMLYIQDSNVADEPVLESRLDACVSYIRNHPNDSHIVYTVFDNTFYQIQHLLGRTGIVCDQFDISPSKFNQTITNFNRGITKVLVVSGQSIHRMRGVTLSKAAHLIFFYEQPVYGQGLQQMIHSAQRLGRSEPLTLVHLRGLE